MISAADWEQKLKTVYQQTKQVLDPVRPFVVCGCNKKLQIQHAYKCLYCGEWYCAPCAEVHFGQTRQEYRKTHPVEGMSTD